MLIERPNCKGLPGSSGPAHMLSWWLPTCCTARLLLWVVLLMAPAVRTKHIKAEHTELLNE
jgi:hypothetical protein